MLYTTELLGHIWSFCNVCVPILTKIFSSVKKIGTFFSVYSIYCPVDSLKGERKMYENGELGTDLDDLIFEKDAGGPSER